MRILMMLLIVYLVAVNLVAFVLMGVDKYRAKHDQWRISERMLFLFPLVFGSLGGVLGMQVFHHKTRHWYFRYGLPLILVVQLMLAGMLYFRFF